MTVTAQGFSGPTWVQTPGNGAATVYNFSFLITAATDLVVGFITGGVYSQQSSASYSIPASSIGNSGGGQLTFATAPPLGTTVDLRSQIPETQPTNFSNLGAYLPENTTNAVDRITRLVTDLYRLSYQFGIHGPDQENVPWTTLPVASSRAGGALVFDNNGLPTIGVLTSSVLTQAIFNTFLSSASWYQQTPAESLASVIPTNLLYPAGDLRRYGGDPTGVASSLSALQQAIAQSRQYQGANVYLSAGIFNIGAGLVDAPVSAASGLKISGAGKNATTIISTGTVALNFTAPLYQDMILSDFCIGNNTTNQISGTAIQISAVRGGSIFRNLQVNGNPTIGTTIGWKCLGLASGIYSGELQIEDCFFNNTLQGVSFNGIMTSGTVSGCEFNNGAVIANSVGVYQANTCYGQNVTQCQFSQNGIGIQTFGLLLSEWGNIFSDNITNSFQWNVGAGNTVINNVSFADRQLACASSYPTAAQYGCVVIGPTAQGVGSININGLSLGPMGGSPAMGMFGAALQVGPQTTWGTPTNGAVVPNFPGVGATLAQNSQALAELLTYLKSIGILAA